MRAMSVRRRCSFILTVFCLAALPSSAVDRTAPDKPEPGSVEAIAKFVTETRFNNPWVSYVPESNNPKGRVPRACPWVNE